MIMSTFYREQAASQERVAAGATLDNVRDRARRAANAWASLADRSERADDARAQVASDRLLSNAATQHPDGISATA